MTAALLALLLAPAQPAPWPLDEIRLTNGAKLRGMLLDESAAGVRFRMVRRPPGKPTVTLTCLFPPDEVTSLVKLADADRALLRTKLAEYDAGASGERQRAAELDLKPAAWLGQAAGAKQYDGEAFTLVSSADDELTRRAAVRLEQIFTAYSRHLPPRVATATPVMILIAPSNAEYAALLGDRPILNPAVYDPAANRIAVGSDLRILSSDLAAARLHHVQQLAIVDDYDKRVRELYRTAPQAERDRHFKTAADERAKVFGADRANDRKFHDATATLFALLYHETFHAHVTNSVYPPLTKAEIEAGRGPGALPRWLNEGLAQLFETAILDGGELRVGHADNARLDRVQTALKAKKPGVLVPLEKLLIAGPDDFIAAHASRKETTDAVYLTGWAVTFHLTFQKHIVGTARFEEYLKAVNSGGDPRKAFETLVGKNLDAYTAELNDYLLKLQPDGSLRK